MSLAADICQKYKGQLVEIYVGEKTGTKYYAEEDTDKRTYLTATVDGYVGDLVELTCTIITPHREYQIPMSIFAWDVKGIMVKRNDGIHITQLYEVLRK